MNKISLLILDDEKNVLSSLKRLFRGPQYDLHLASSPQEALEILGHKDIGIIISDYKMGPMKGTDFLAITKKKWPAISRILLTGYFNSQIAQSSLQEGEVYRFMTKPWNDDDLIMTVKNSWKRHQLLKQNQSLLTVIKSQNRHLRHLTLNLKQVIENRIEKTAQSERAIRAKKIQLQISHSIIKGLGHAKNLKEIFKIILRELHKLVPFDDASIIVELNNHTHHLLKQKATTKQRATVKTLPISIKKFPLIEKIFQSKTPVITSKGLELWSQNKKTFQSHLIFPLLKENHEPEHCLGTLNLAAKRKHGFSHDDVIKLSDIANPIAIAIEKMKLLEIIEQGSRQWESTFDAIGDLVTVIDNNFNLMKANLTIEKIANQKVNKVIGKKCYEVLANRKSPCKNCPAVDTLKSKDITAENEITDFKDRDYLSWAYPMTGPKKNVTSMVVYYRNHTESSQLFRQLIQAEKMSAIGHLASSLAHELNNPLTGITAFAQILKKDLGKKNPIYPDIVEIEKASFRCKNIIDNLLNFSEKKQSKTTKVAVNDIIDSTLPLIQYSSSGKQNVQIRKKFGKKMPKIMGNANKLQQVFLNLLLNAFQAMPEGGDLIIKTAYLPRRASVQITISDSGVGIPKQNLSKIFDPFYTTKEKTRGTGLGLSVSYGIIREHNGKIEIQSELKKGSTFKVTLPVEKKH